MARRRCFSRAMAPIRIAFPAAFDSNMLSLVDRGFVYAIAHVRGGLEKGERWRNAGRCENKVNTFKDFIAVAEHLGKAGYTAPGRIVARGDSAGGLLMGVVANMRPDLFAGIIARVPFVDVLNTMLDESLPLTADDFSGMGRPDPRRRRLSQPSPAMRRMTTSPPSPIRTCWSPPGSAIPACQYWEPAKWVAKIRAMKTNDARIALVTRMSAGHFGAAGRFAELDEAALIQAFALDVAGMQRGRVATLPQPDRRDDAPHRGAARPSASSTVANAPAADSGRRPRWRD